MPHLFAPAHRPLHGGNQVALRSRRHRAAAVHPFLDMEGLELSNGQVRGNRLAKTIQSIFVPAESVRRSMLFTPVQKLVDDHYDEPVDGGTHG